jgi:hypothetical protein
VNSKYFIGDLHCSDARAFFGAGISVERVGWMISGRWRAQARSLSYYQSVLWPLTVDLRATGLRTLKYSRVKCTVQAFDSYRHTNYIRRQLLLSLYLPVGYSE